MIGSLDMWKLGIFLLILTIQRGQAQEQRRPINLRLSYSDLIAIIDNGSTQGLHEVFDGEGLHAGMLRVLTGEVKEYQQPEEEFELDIHPALGAAIDSVGSTAWQNILGKPGFMLSFSMGATAKDMMTIPDDGPIYEYGCACVPSTMYTLLLDRAMTKEARGRFGGVAAVYVDRRGMIRRIRFSKAFWRRDVGERNAMVVGEDGKSVTVLLD